MTGRSPAASTISLSAGMTGRSPAASTISLSAGMIDESTPTMD
eukprot:CAMPEP_0113657770 /NCGR_PEP_ID=MMETSP0017_2-20120614/31281_1 /TAXON_ID=2856 /ORGANISM="Cylindrotheca closterium" /LENGTH=42 /DNA_ID=CAMNT_0000571835 /DNA_START=41 /DNA_END=169 /DNA_ORIENTATION=+ /assembly_acc=CAM_ASM_000147